MKMKYISVLTLLGIAAVAVWFLMPEGGASKARQQKAGTLVSREVKRARSSRPNRGELRVVTAEKGGRYASPKVEEWNPFGAEKPSFDFDDELEAQLSEDVKGIIAELNDAFRRPDTDKQAVCRAVQKLIDYMYGSPASVGGGRGAKGSRSRGGSMIASLSGGGSGNVPAFVKERALDALKWVGADAMPETVVMVADADPQITTIAKEVLMEQMMDFDAREADIVAAIKQLVQVDMEPGQYESMMFTVSSFKNSNKVDVALTVYDKGTDQAFEALSKNVDFIFDQSESESIQTKEDIIQYGKDHPDGKDDLDFDVFSTVGETSSAGSTGK